MSNSIAILKSANGKPIERVTVEDTRFIFKTNFQGDPRRDEKFGSRECKGNIIVDEDFARDLMELGCNVRTTNPDEDGNVQYFVAVKLNFNSWRGPKIYIVSGGNEPRPIDEDTIGLVDSLADKRAVANVKLVASTYKADNGKFKTLWIDTMYVEQGVDDDPFYEHYRNHSAPDDEDELPFA